MTDDRISAKASACLDLFFDCIATLKIKGDEPTWNSTVDQLGRFQIWASNIGVFADVRSSLDYRLREADDIRKLTVQIITSIHDCLGSCNHHLAHFLAVKNSFQNGDKPSVPVQEDGISLPINIDRSQDRSGLEALSDSGSASDEDGNHEELVFLVRDSIDWLHRLSNSIRDASSLGHYKRAKKFPLKDPNDPHGKDLSSTFVSAYDKIIGRQFPGLDEKIRLRLAEGVVLRRKRILYRRERQQKWELRHETYTRKQPGVTKAPEGSAISRATTTPRSPTVKEAEAEAEVASPNVNTPSRLSATTLQPSKVKRTRPASTIASSTNTSPLNPHDKDLIPALPAEAKKDKDFVCPYCCVIISSDDALKRGKWPQHIQKDLDPYICLFNECLATGEDLLLFSTREDWLDHMRAEHCMRWHCVIGNHEPKAFPTEDDFITHMKYQHPGSFDEESLTFVAASSARPLDEVFGPNCPFCSESLADPVAHISDHLKYIALYTLPSFDVDDTISKTNSLSAKSFGSVQKTRTTISSPEFPIDALRGDGSDFTEISSVERVIDEAVPDLVLPEAGPTSQSERLLVWGNIANMHFRQQHKELRAHTIAKDDVLRSMWVLAHPEKDLPELEDDDSVSSRSSDIDFSALRKKTRDYPLSDSEKECLQVFNLSDGTDGVSYERYKSRVKDRMEDTYNWFLDHPKFKDWMGQESGVLMVTGDPKCGKSALAKYLIDHRLPKLSITTCYFFFRNPEQSTLEQAFCALLHQLFSHEPSLIRHAMPEYFKNKSNLRGMSFALWGILVEASKDLETGSVVCVLDALDKCKPSDLDSLLKMLKYQLNQDGGLGKLKFLLTSHPYDETSPGFYEINGYVFHIHIPGPSASEAVSREIDREIKCWVDQVLRGRELPPDINKRHEERLLHDPRSTTYLRAYLVLNLKKSQYSKTGEVPLPLTNTYTPLEDISQAYKHTLSTSVDKKKARKALCIILGARQSLTLAEMNIAVNMDASSTSLPGISLEADEDFKETLRSWCGPLIYTINGYVYLIHHSAREFLQRNDALAIDTVPNWGGTISAHETQNTLALSCVAYLDIIGNSDMITFLDYSAKSWVYHFHNADTEKQETLARLGQRICDPSTDKHLSWFRIYWQAKETDRCPKFIDALQIASYCGLASVVAHLLDSNKVDINPKKDKRREPTWYPTRRGHKRTPKRRVDSVGERKLGIQGCTALSLAARGGHLPVIKLLLDSEKANDINIKDKGGRTPLSYAAKRGHAKVVERLLSSGKLDNVDKRNEHGQTPLLLAARRGHVQVVELLLSSGKLVNVDLQDERGRTPLSHAAGRGYVHIAKLLLDIDEVDVNSKDIYGRAPLSLAAARGHTRVVELLLGIDKVDIDSKDIYGRTALSHAAEPGHARVVELLLDTGRANINAQDEYGRTPLSLAAERRHAKVVELLLTRGGIDFNLEGNRVLNFRNRKARDG
ncbi:hypothetical protein FQN49_000274 [Arthroderma sp. PD_2]|nr:hypothetical protein FQN49_000274 [Arthroderma sp. PD_2]